jgi:glycosyltransferase involved in cell wall biosynthesis
MKFCFFGDVSNSLKGRTKGGGELQIALLAKALALQGHDVVIVDPYSNESFSTSEGIKVVNIPSWNKGIKGIRLFTNRIPCLYKMFKQQNADYYYARMRSYLHIVPFFAARKIRKKFVLAIASDIDVLGFKAKYKHEYKANFKLSKYLSLYLPGDIVFQYLLKRADFILLQHIGQNLNLDKSKGKRIVFPNIIDQNSISISKSSAEDYFIYLGSLSSLKGSDKLLQLVTIIDDAISVIIVGQPNDEKSIEVYRQLGLRKNIILKGRVNHEEALGLVSKAKALLNTSNFEGFPNVFLEAWALGVPVLSLKVNPGNVFDNFKLGICCEGDLEKMKKSMESNLTETIDKNVMQAYINDYHEYTTAGDRFISALLKA